MLVVHFFLVSLQIFSLGTRSPSPPPFALLGGLTFVILLPLQRGFFEAFIDTRHHRLQGSFAINQ